MAASGFLLCSSCRHPYPASDGVLEEAAFGAKVRGSFDKLQQITGSMEVTEAEDVHRLHELRSELQDLCGSVHAEVRSLRDRIATLEGKLGKKTEELSSAHHQVLRATVQSAKRSSGGQGALGGANGPSPSGAPSYNTADANRTVFNGVPEYHLKRMGTALELVSAGIYSLLESLAINTRVDTALLWMRPRNLISNELLAPFVVGRDMTKLLSSAPYRVPETSIPCAVGTTGIAVNLKPRNGVHDTRRTEDIPLAELIEHVNCAQLLVPVHSRYNDAVLAVVHLIGSPRYPFPFHRRNEEAAMHAAAFFSTILSSHHDHMINEWANHFYDPSIIHATSTYRGDLDLAGDDKCVDDFQPPPMLIYRCVNERRADADPREAFMALKQSMSRRAAPMQPVACVKDLHRHATTMESNWVSAVKATSQLEHYVSSYKDGILKDEVDRLRKQREKAQEEADRNAAKYFWRQGAAGKLSSGSNGSSNTSGGGAPPLPNIKPSERLSHTPDTDSSNSSINSVDLAMGLTSAAVAKDEDLDPSDVLKPEEMAEAESLALKRLRNLGIDISGFTSPDSVKVKPSSSSGRPKSGHGAKPSSARPRSTQSNKSADTGRESSKV